MEDPHAARQRAVLQLQGLIGNQAMGQLIAQTRQSGGTAGARTPKIMTEARRPLQGDPATQHQSGVIQRRELKGSERTDLRQAVRFGLDAGLDAIKSSYPIAGNIERYVTGHDEYDESNVRANLAYGVILHHNAGFLGDLLSGLPEDAREAGLAELDTLVKGQLSEVCGARQFMRQAAYSYLQQPEAFRDHLQSVITLAQEYWAAESMHKYIAAAFDHEKGYDETKDTLSGIGQAVVVSERGQEEATYRGSLVSEWLQQQVNTNILKEGFPQASMTREQMIGQSYGEATKEQRQHLWSTLVTYFTNRHAHVDAALAAISPQTAALSALFTEQEIREGRSLVAEYF